MNRYPLNSQVLGAGSRVPLTMATAAQAMYLTVVAAGHAIRQAKLNGVLANTQSVKTTITRVFKAAQLVTLAAVVAPRTWYKTYIDGSALFKLTPTVSFRQLIRKTATAAQTLTLVATSNIHQWIKVYALGVQNLAMSTKSKYQRRLLLITNQALAMKVSLRMLAKRFWKMAVTPMLVTTNNARKAVLGEAVSQAMQLAYESVATRRTAIHATAARAMTLVTDVVGRTASRVEIAQAVAINYVANSRAWIKRRVELAQALRLSSFVDALDATSRPATVERTVAIPNLSRIVVVPGESYISGV